jgi:NAD(P)-dependent dehydrogenase (short-subunit alcohol dehydrogenase family)
VAEVALICGAAGALGRSLVESFLARGDEVVAVQRRPPPAELPADARTEIADLTAPDEVEALWDRLEQRDQLPRWVVNAAGGFRGGSVAESDPKRFRELQAVNLETAWWSCRAAARRLRAGGAIVNVGSRAALEGGAGAAAYAVSKAAVLRLTEVLAAELGPGGVRVNAVVPALIDTPANRLAMPGERLQSAVAPERIAAVVAFLCSEAASAVTGTLVRVYGTGA